MLEFLSENSDLCQAITSICAVFISVGAIFISVISLHIQRRHNRKSLMPKAVISIESMDRIITVFMSNNGTGPMEVTGMVIAFQGAVLSYFSEIMAGLHKQKVTEEDYIGEYLSPDKRVRLFSITFEYQEDLEAAWKIIKDISVELTYKSIYNKRYVEKINFQRSYDVFMSALGNRELEAFGGKIHRDTSNAMTLTTEQTAQTEKTLEQLVLHR